MSEAQRVALVSDGATGLGRAVVESLSSAGWRVAFSHARRHKPQAIELSHRLFIRGGEVAYVEAELGDVEQRRWAVASTTARFDRLDALVVVPEVPAGVSWSEAAAEDWRHSHESVVVGPMLLFEDALASLERYDGCCIGVVPRATEIRDDRLLAATAAIGLASALSALSAGLRGRVRVHDLVFDPELCSRPAVASLVAHLAGNRELEGRSFVL